VVSAGAKRSSLLKKGCELDEKVFKDRALGYKGDWCVAFFSSFDATSVAAGVEKKEREKKRFGHSLKPDVEVFKNAS